MNNDIANDNPTEMIASICNLSPLEAEAEGLRIQRQLRLQGEALFLKQVTRKN